MKFIWDRFNDQVELGLDTIGALFDWNRIGHILLLIIVLPVLVPVAAVCWPIGYVTERRRNRADGIKDVR